MRTNNEKCLHRSIKVDGIENWVSYTPSTVIVGRSVLCFGKPISVNNKTSWRTSKTDKLFKIIQSKDNEIAFLGIRMLFNILNFKGKNVDEFIEKSIR